MRKLLIIFLVLLTGCVTASPTQSLQQRQMQRLQEFLAEAKNDTVIAAWNLKGKLKKDYREIVGPSDSFDERAELQFFVAFVDAVLATPGFYERLVGRGAASGKEPLPSRSEYENTVKIVRGRIKELDVHVINEIQAAEQQAKQDAERRQAVIKVLVGIAIVALAVAGGAAAASAASRPAYGSTNFGPYVITRAGPTTTTVVTPSGRMYTCTTTGTYQLSVVNCF